MGDLSIRRARRYFRWSKETRELVAAHVRGEGLPLRQLLDRLVEVSGNPRRACLRFAQGLGVQPPARRGWTSDEEERLLRLVESRSVPEIARSFRRSTAAIYSKLWKLGATGGVGDDSFTVRSLAAALQTGRNIVQAWIDKGFLQARTSGSRTTITADDFAKFCKKHRNLVVGRRLNQERLEFIRTFVFAPSHVDLLPVRDSKKERAAYEAQKGPEDPEVFSPSKVTNIGIGQANLELSA
jgi:hypothetical protein